MPDHLPPSERSLPRELVRSPYVASAPEGVAILESVREAQVEIDMLSQDISDLQEAIKRLEARRTRAETYARFQQSLLAPIRKLPSEVLAEIFLYCIPRIVIEGAVKNRSMQLAGVSCHWRRIIQNLPVFWSSFDVNLTQTLAGHPIGQVADNLMRRAISAVSMAVSRSGLSPLRFHLEAPSIDAIFGAVDIISVLYPHRHRWQCVSLSLQFPHVLEHLMTPLVRQKFPALRSLRMHSHCRLPNIIDAFEIAPQLTQLYLGSFVSIMNSLKLPWAQITHFKSHMNRIWLENTSDVFNAMPNLEKFESIWDHSLCRVVGQVNIETPAHLPNLRSLSLANSITGLPLLLHGLAAPRLEELILDCDTMTQYIRDFFSRNYVATNLNDPESDCLALLNGIHNFIVASSCTLQTLMVDHIKCGFIHQMLQLYPQIYQVTFFMPEDIFMFLAHNLEEPNRICFRYEHEGPKPSVLHTERRFLNAQFSFNKLNSEGAVNLRVRRRDMAERAVAEKSAWQEWGIC